MKTKAPKKLGRPQNEEDRSIQVQIRLTAEEHALMTAAAKKDARPLSTWIRWVALFNAKQA